MLSSSNKSTCPFCDQPYTRLGAHLPKCKQRHGRDYTDYLAKNSAVAKQSQRGRCPSCNRVFKHLDTHLRVSAVCKLAGCGITAQLPRPSTTTTATTVGVREAMNSIEPNSASTQPKSNEPKIHFATPFNLPQTDKDWDVDNRCLGSTIVHQVLEAQSVDDKNTALCVGIQNYFTTKYGLKGKRRPACKNPRRHNRTIKRVTQEKNMASKELRAARREGKDDHVIRELARKFYQLIRLHSKTKQEQLRAKVRLEAGKARQECARSFWRFAAKILDDRENSPEPTFTAENAESYFREVYSSSPREYTRPPWLPATKPPHCAFNDAPITTSEISEVIKRSRSTSSPSPMDRVSYKILKRCPALLPALSDLYNACWELQTVPLAWKQGVIRLIPKQSAYYNPNNQGCL